MIWPGKKKCALAFIDDTDDAVLPDIKSIYKILLANGIKTTKTIWGTQFVTLEFRLVRIFQRMLSIIILSNTCRTRVVKSLYSVGSGPFFRRKFSLDWIYIEARWVPIPAFMLIIATIPTDIWWE